MNTRMTLTLLTLLLPLVPGAAAAEPVHTEYVALGTPVLPLTTVCPPNEVPCLGGFRSTPQGEWNNVDVVATDELAGWPYLALCILFEDHLHLTCGDEPGEAYVQSGCGIVQVRDVPMSGSEGRVEGLVYNLFFDPTTSDICLGSRGEVSAIYY